LLLELQDFIRCVRENGTPRVTAADGLRTVELAQTIREQLNRVVVSMEDIAIPVQA
jgi:predicted dehydrogenase